MSILPEILPFLHCPKINIKFISPEFCQKRKTMKKNPTSQGVIFESPTIAVCHECQEPIIFIK